MWTNHLQCFFYCYYSNIKAKTRPKKVATHTPYRECRTKIHKIYGIQSVAFVYNFYYYYLFIFAGTPKQKELSEKWRYKSYCLCHLSYIHTLFECRKNPKLRRSALNHSFRIQTWKNIISCGLHKKKTIKNSRKQQFEMGGWRADLYAAKEIVNKTSYLSKLKYFFVFFLISSSFKEPRNSQDLR